MKGRIARPEVGAVLVTVPLTELLFLARHLATRSRKRATDPRLANAKTRG